MIWRAIFFGLAVSGFGVAQERDAAAQSLHRGVEFLLAQQAEDGGWHSTTYGSMKQGAAVTASVVYALSHLPPEKMDARRKEVLDAFEFLRRGISKRGYVVNPDGSADFPTYATAMLLVAADRFELPLTVDERSRLIKFVEDAQLTETREFGEGSIHHGGWDLMGAQRIIGQTSGTNVSITRFAVEALALSDSAESKAALLRARRWSRGIQDLSGDGGFFFTPDADSENNKALFDKEEKENGESRRPRSYGTATCDGLLLLTATGLGSDDARVAAAVRWLVDHPEVGVVPGFAKDTQPTGWQEGLRYYYSAALAKSVYYLPDDEAASRRAALIQVLVEAQQTDGSWKNSSARMREDDPLICTSFAVTALSTLLNSGRQN